MFSWLKKKNAVPAVKIDSPALRKILDSKYCGQCSRNCKLSAPRCGRGKKQAEVVKREFEQAK